MALLSEVQKDPNLDLEAMRKDPTVWPAYFAQLPEYAKANESEMMAECFAMVMAGKSLPMELAAWERNVRHYIIENKGKEVKE